jgi:hypothetical protein
MDFDSLVNGRATPQQLISANYTGILSPKFFVEGQYSQRKFTFENSGSLFTDLVKGTLLIDQSRGNARYNSPTFCGICDPEKRDNQNITAKATYFASTGNLGAHNVVVGFDLFDDKRFANNPSRIGLPRPDHVRDHQGTTLFPSSMTARSSADADLRGLGRQPFRTYSGSSTTPGA